MNNPDLDDLLRSYADKPVPRLPGNLEDAVWREIRLRRETPTHDSFLDWLAAYVGAGILRLLSWSPLWYSALASRGSLRMQARRAQFPVR